MKFLLDENISKSVALFLNQLGHQIFRIKEINPGAEDFQVLGLALRNQAILITLDKDYGELVFKKGKIHRGVILLRLEDQTTGRVEKALLWLLSAYYEEKIIGKFVVVTEKARIFKARFDKIIIG